MSSGTENICDAKLGTSIVDEAVWAVLINNSNNEQMRI